MAATIQHHHQQRHHHRDKALPASPVFAPSSSKSATKAIRRASSILGLRSLRGRTRDHVAPPPIDEQDDDHDDHHHHHSIASNAAVRMPFLGDDEVKSRKRPGHKRGPSTETQLLHHYERQYQVDDDHLMDMPSPYPTDHQVTFYDSPRSKPPIASSDHAGPLNSNPLTTSHEKQKTTTTTTTREAQNASARALSDLHDSISFATEWQSILQALRQSTGSIMRPPLPIAEDALDSPTFPPGHNSSINAHLEHLVSPLDPLKTANNFLLTHIARQEGTIEAQKTTLEEHEATMARQETAIAELNRQLRSKDSEHKSLAETFRAENTLLREENAKLKAQVEKLQQITAKAVASSMYVDSAKRPMTPKSDSVHQDPVSPIECDGEEDDDDDELLLGLNDDDCVSPISTAGNDSSDGGDAGSPDTLATTCHQSPRSFAATSIQSLYAATPVPGSMRVSSIYSTLTDQRQTRNSRQLSISVSVQPPAESKQPHIGFLGAQLTPLLATAARTELERDLASARKRIEEAEQHRDQLEARAASQAVLIQQLTKAATSSSAPSPASPTLSIPDLPVLTYTKSALIWLDRLTTSMRYLGLADFIQRDLAGPPPSHHPSDTASARADTEAWNSQRLRAAVLIKQAVDDEILEDVLYLASRKPADATTQQQQPPPAENPYWLLKTIQALRRTLPTSATDLSWVDRIQNTDYESIRDFASLVLCIDRRHGLLYGTSVDHYDAMLPRIQANLEKRFPDLEKSSLMGDTFGPAAVKWRHLPTWMAKMVRKKSLSEVPYTR